MASNLPQARAAKRRSIRMGLTVPVGVIWRDSVGRHLNSNAKANNLNLHGAAIRVGEDMPIGTEVIIRHGRGAQKSARIVSLVRAIDSNFVYGIEFLPVSEPALGFWGIHFPETSQSQSRAAQ
jgi:hypothetical protein